MAQEAITIAIELDDSSVRTQVAKLEKNAESAGKKVGQALTDQTSAEIQKLTEAIKNLNSNLSMTGKDKKNVLDLNSSFERLNKSVEDNGNRISETIKQTNSLASGLGELVSILVVAGAAWIAFSGSILKTLGFSAFQNQSNILDLLEELIAFSFAAGAAGSALTGFDGLLGDIGGSLQTVSAGAAIAATAITFALSKFGSAINYVGDQFVELSKKAVQSFSAFEQSQAVLNKIIQNFNQITGNAVGSTELWTETISKLGKELGLARTSLNSAATEIIQVGARLGLTTEQMQKLLRVSAEYAQINGKDVFDTTVALVSALNGNAQAVLNYGIKLTETSNAQFLFKKGIVDSFQTMSDAEKVQVRFNNLLSQYAGIAGVAAATSDTLANQNKRLENNLNELSSAYGRGAAIVENWQVASFLANKAVNTLNESFVSAIGFVGALSGRFLQGAGTVIKYGAALYTVVRALTLINELVSTRRAQDLLSRRFEIIGDSISGLIAKLAGGSVKLDSLLGILNAFGRVISQEGGRVVRVLTGVNAATSSTTAIIAGGFQRIGMAFALLGQSIGSLAIAFAPIALKAAAIGAAIYVVYEALRRVEQQTGIFSSALNELKSIFDSILGVSSDLASSFSQALTPAIEFAIAAFDRLVGLVAFGLTTSISIVGQFLQLIPGFSSSFKSLDSAISKLTNLRQGLLQTGFSLKEFGQTVQSSMSQSSKAFQEVNFEKLAEIRKQVEDIAIGERGILGRNLAEQVREIGKAAMAGVISSAEAGRQITILTKNYWKQVREISRKGLVELENDLKSFRDLVASFGLNESEQIELEQNKRLQQAKLFFERGLIQRAEFEKLSTAIADEAQRKRQEIVERETYTWNDALQELAGAARAGGQIVVGTMERLGASLLIGGAAFGDFRGFILNILGDILIQVGTAVAGIGKAIDLLAASFTSFFGGFAVAGGLALIALGGLMKAASGSLSGAAAAGAGASFGGGGGAGVSPVPEFTEAPETDEARSRITVNIQGDVLDSRDTGLRIVELIQDAFDTNGAKVVTA